MYVFICKSVKYMIQLLRPADGYVHSLTGLNWSRKCLAARSNQLIDAYTCTLKQGFTGDDI